VHATGHDTHRGNYLPLKAFFSRASITRVEGQTLERLDKLYNQLQFRRNTGEIVNLTHAFNSFVTGKSLPTLCNNLHPPALGPELTRADVISCILFDEPSDLLSDPTFNSAW
jgi:hypothetical protein